MVFDQKDFPVGVRQGLPIGLGYLSVSFSFGIMASQLGFPWWAALLISMTNLTSAGQVAGILIIAAGGGILELAISELVINLRYALMSVTLTQKVEKMSRPLRALLSFGITDEIFALCANREGKVNFPFFLGTIVLPYLGWATGTLLGSIAGSLLPPLLIGVLGVAIYGMFLAIVLPTARKERNVALVCIFSVLLSCLFYYVPGLNKVSEGISIIICTIAASAAGALLFPVRKDDQETAGKAKEGAAEQ